MGSLIRSYLIMLAIKLKKELTRSQNRLFDQKSYKNNISNQSCLFRIKNC